MKTEVLTVKAVDLAVAVVLVALALEVNPVVVLVALAADLVELAIKAARAVRRSRRRAAPVEKAALAA